MRLLPNECTAVTAELEIGKAKNIEGMKMFYRFIGRFLWLSAALLAVAQADELLDPEVAFALTVSARDADTLVVDWNIVDGYYLYRERTSFEPATPGVALGEPRFPKGKVKEDEFFGKMEIYRGDIDVEIPLIRDAVTDTMDLKVTYQGCADVGVCYPPQTQTYTVALLAPTTSNSSTITNPVPPPTASAGDQVPMVSEQDMIAQMLVGERFWAMPAFFGFGLLLAFTPCVFPMIPILSSIIVGQGGNLTQQRAFMLSLIYVLAMASTYTVAGVLAALMGQNIQAIFQNPWVLATFSGLFVLLALSMFGFYDLQLPSSWQSKLSEISNRQSSGTYIGVAVMGFFSALIVGPCVAAPLIGVLTVIAATGDTALGGSALFTMSLGMGAPLLMIGASAGKLLPRAGVWMDKVKAVFGVLLLAVAIWMLERILPEAVSMLLWAILLIVSAIYMGALQTLSKDAPGSHKLVQGSGTVLLVYGILLLVGVAAGGNDPLQPLRGVGFLAGNGAGQTEHIEFKPIKTVADLEREIVRANGQPVMLDFYADWCVSCKEMEKYTFNDPGVRAMLRNAILLQADVTANDEEDQALLRRFGIIGPPAILFFDADGMERPPYRVVGFMPADVFQSHLAGALDFGNTSSNIVTVNSI